MTSVYSGSAKIYQFPTKTRAASNRFDHARFATTMSSPGVVPTAFGSGWYHDEAIHEDEQTRKN